MSRGNGGGGDAPTNPMPVLDTAVREALTESIREHGVICPVVKDQTGFVLDGYNRIAIAAELDVPCPEVVHECGSAQRDILRVELNGARRQLTDWKPLVDHLRAQRTPGGARRFSDRTIARAVGVDKDTVNRYKPSETATVSVGTVAVSTLGEDGKVRHSNKEWTATDRVLHLIAQSSSGLTHEDLQSDPVLCEFDPATVARIPSTLRDRGLVVAAGKRGRCTIWAAAPPGPPPSTEPVLSRKVNKIIDDLADPKVRDEYRLQLADRKGARQAEADLRAAERELEAARLAKEKREADAEKERLRQIDILFGQGDTSVKAWDKLIGELRAAALRIGAYVKVTDELPAISPVWERMLDREIAGLRLQLDYLTGRLHPNGDGAALRNTVIDVG